MAEMKTANGNDSGGRLSMWALALVGSLCIALITGALAANSTLATKKELRDIAGPVREYQADKARIDVLITTILDQQDELSVRFDDVMGRLFRMEGKLDILVQEKHDSQ